ncbi:ribonuclease M5 [Ruminococcus albus]|uniref:Ribonuclease M5 n=2 Tax=Ruminococcus albus TaxID=1264 RepID=A0A1I1DUV3_RUMAL|nr:ribonuclease M5 [Ruminococcus albus]
MMEKIKVKQAVVVEGKYDKIALKNVIDGVIITTDGFGVYRSEDKIKLIQMYAKSVGLIILTDSDTAGQQIRGRIKSLVGDAQIINVYCPVIFGKERRKDHASKEGKLGVEGMSVEVLREAFEKAGLAGDAEIVREPVTKQDMIALGLNGSPNSSLLREKAAESLGLPAKLSSNALRDAVSTMMGRDAFIEFINKMKGAEK